MAYRSSSRSHVQTSVTYTSVSCRYCVEGVAHITPWLRDTFAFDVMMPEVRCCSRCQNEIPGVQRGMHAERFQPGCGVKQPAPRKRLPSFSLIVTTLSAEIQLFPCTTSRSADSALQWQCRPQMKPSPVLAAVPRVSLRPCSRSDWLDRAT